MTLKNVQSADLIRPAFEQGDLIVYPTEAVMGIGCDPDNETAVLNLLSLKQRPREKGVILIADSYSRLLRYVDDKAIPSHRRTEVFSSWPGHITWLLPKSMDAPNWITGEHDKIAVRVTAHPVVISLCQTLGKPLVSTSANPSGASPALTTEEAKQYFGDRVIYASGEVTCPGKPSVIKDCETGQVIRG